MKITDDKGNILTVYGTYSADGSTRYDALEVKPVAGDTVTVYGIVGQYNNTPQVKDGWITSHVPAEGGNTGDNEGGNENPGTDTPVTPPTDTTTAKVVIAEYAAANGWANSTLYSNITVNADITVTASGTPVGSWGQNTGKYYESGDGTWRIYQNENPAVTVTAAEGKTIVSVKITYVSNKTGVLTLNGEHIASETVVEVNAGSITFSVANTGTATNGQAQITAIEVIYG